MVGPVEGHLTKKIGAPGVAEGRNVTLYCSEICKKKEREKLSKYEQGQTVHMSEVIDKCVEGRTDKSTKRQTKKYV